MFRPILALTAVFGALTEAPEAPQESTPERAPAPSSFVWSDYDGDRRVDAFVLTPSGEGALLKNLGDGSFRDATVEAGLSDLPSLSAASWQDVDADGTPDLLLNTAAGAPILFLNRSGTAFEDVTEASGLPQDGTTAARWLDYDVDGLPDLLLSGAAGEALLHNLGDGVFEPALGAGLGRVARPSAPAAGPAPAPAADDAAPTATGTGSENASAGPVGSATVGSATSTGRLDPSAAMQFCDDSIMDQATGNCLTASSIPTLGMLYPLGNELSIDASGFVGIGTTTPAARLHVVGGDVWVNGRFRSTAAAGPPMIVSSSEVVTNFNADQLDGFDASDFSQLGNLIETAEIANFAVTPFKIANDAVGSQHIGNGVIGNVHVNGAAAIDGTKIDPDFGTQDVTSNGRGRFRGLAGEFSVKGLSDGLNTPTNGYLGVQGTVDFDGISTADWNGFEIGVAGISTGSGTTDNYGVIGHSNGAGVRGAHSANPGQNFGELGKSNRGVNAKGTSQAMYGENSVDALNWASIGTTLYGVQAEGDSAGGDFYGDLDGVRGETDAVNGYGVWGRSDYRGVYGQATASGGYGIYSGGDMTATGAKLFTQPHPSDPLQEIRFVSLEGNESGTYFRGSSRLVGGTAVIDVPEEFRLVTSASQGLTVQVTVVGAPATVWVESKDLDRIVVRGNLDADFDYFVNGVRRGYEAHEPFAANRSFLPMDEGEAFGAQYPDAYRQILVENGILLPDFTPNPATRQLMETQLDHYRARLEARDRAAAEAATSATSGN